MSWRQSEGDEPTWLYRLYDAQGTLLYVGITRRAIRLRMYGHKSRSCWWPEVAGRFLVRYEDRRSAWDAETRAIAGERPQHNVSKTPRMARAVSKGLAAPPAQSNGQVKRRVHIPRPTCCLQHYSANRNSG
jgi:hypothetical protein